MEDRDFERRFLQTPGDAYALYQLKDSLENGPLRYESYSSLTRKLGLSVESANYEPTYTGVIATENRSSIPVILEELFAQFNLERTSDFKGRSMSVSDVIVLKLNGQVTAHYVDTIGFRELHGFLDNPLKSAEMSVEDDYGMIDGIINNGKRPSVMEQLKQPTKQALKPAQPKRNIQEEAR